VICTESAHIQCDEGGAPEFVGSLKMHLCPSADGKLTVAMLQSQLRDRDSVHRAQPGAVSIANTTELGTVYSCEEVKVLADCAHAAGLPLHLDGARIANAAAALSVPLRAFTTDAGVDVVSFGGTKAGAMAAEAVIVLNPALLPGMAFLRKSAMQLCSKQRFLSAQLIALLEGEEGEAEHGHGTPLCIRLAAHANAMAARMLSALRLIPGVVLPASVDDGSPLANAIFPTPPPGVAEKLRALGYRFYTWDGSTGQVRFMCSWDTTEEDVDGFVEALRQAMVHA
jgi:threonine aldolase